jgi:hypothetical protein
MAFHSGFVEITDPLAPDDFIEDRRHHLRTTYAVFATRCADDFICMVIAEMLPVKIICALSGLTTGMSR